MLSLYGIDFGVVLRLLTLILLAIRNDSMRDHEQDDLPPAQPSISGPPPQG